MDVRKGEENVWCVTLDIEETEKGERHDEGREGEPCDENSMVKRDSLERRESGKLQRKCCDESCPPGVERRIVG